MSITSPASAHSANAAGMSGSSRTVLNDGLAEVSGQSMNLDTVHLRNVRHVKYPYAENDHLFVQGLVMLEAVQQSMWNGIRVRRHEHRGSRYAFHAPAVMLAMNGARSMVSVARRWPSSSRPRFQVVNRVKMARPKISGNQPPSGILSSWQEEAEVDTDERQGAKHGAGRAPCPEANGHGNGQKVGNQHRSGYRRYTIGRRKIRRGTEFDDQRDNGRQQQPVDPRQVDLPDFLSEVCCISRRRGIAELNRLLGDRGRHRKSLPERR